MKQTAFIGWLDSDANHRKFHHWGRGLQVSAEHAIVTIIIIIITTVVIVVIVLIFFLFTLLLLPFPGQDLSPLSC